MTTTRPTLADVARAAGVGVATVSRALGEHPDVSEDTRARVREAARTLGYRPSATARALRRGAIRAVSAIVPDLAWGWWEPVLTAAARAARAEGYHLFVHPIAGTEGGIAAVVEGLANVPTEGVVVVSVPDQAELRVACDGIRLPVVAIDDTSREVHLPTVAVRNREAARIMTGHLLEAGHRTIAYLGVTTGGEPFPPYWGDGLFADERLAGYREALEDAGVAVDDRLVLDWPTPDDETGRIVPGLDALLRSGRVPDAILCAADLLGAPVLRTLSAHGLSVPRDVVVAGFDDERAALLLDPQLTTMRQPYDEMGRFAIELLLRSIAGERLPARRYELDTRLVVRDSTTRTPAD